MSFAEAMEDFGENDGSDQVMNDRLAILVRLQYVQMRRGGLAIVREAIGDPQFLGQEPQQVPDIIDQIQATPAE